MWWIGKGMDNLRSWAGNDKPLYFAVETTKLRTSSVDYPRPEDIKSEVWMALVHGSSMVSYFCHIFSPTFIEEGPLSDPVIGAALKDINRQIKSLALV